jgi:hypothetical protein
MIHINYLILKDFNNNTERIVIIQLQSERKHIGHQLKSLNKLKN